MAKGKYRDWINPDGLLRIEGWARDKLTDKEIAEIKIGINEATFCRWKDKHPSIVQSLKKGREPINIMVENTFREEKLKGRMIKEKIVERTVHKDADGEITGSTEHVKETERYIPADTTAMIFYMKCRMPEKYNDKINLSVENKSNGKLADLIEGLKEDDIHTETEEFYDAVAEKQTETN